MSSQETQHSGIFAAVVSRPVAMTMLFLAAVVFGFVSLQQLPVELMPDLNYPTITVRTTWEGAAPQEIETEVSRPLESALATLDGLMSLESRSRAGTSDVVLGFSWDADLAAASQQIREQIQTVIMPDDVDRPLILRYDPSTQPFLRLAISYDPAVIDLEPNRALGMIRDLSDNEIRRALEATDGVAAAQVRGGLEREIRVVIHQEKLAARGLTAEQLRDAITAENVDVAGGSVFEGDTQYLVRTLGTFRSLDDIRSLLIRRTDGVLVQLSDVADVIDDFAERTVVAHLDGAEAVEIELFKEADANVVDVSHRVQSLIHGTKLGYTKADIEALEPGPQRAAMEAALEASKGLEDRLPAGVRIAELDNTASFIELAIDNLRDAVYIGAFLAIVMIYLFLADGRATAIIGIAIPVSVLVAFAALYMAGVSLNLMSLGGLALGVGMLADNAVVVIEAVQRHLDAGTERHQAAIRGTREITGAVVASTLTTVAVFLPIGFVEGVGGELFGDMALAVFGSLVASLAVALFLVPTLAALGGLSHTPDTQTPVQKLAFGALIADKRKGLGESLAQAGWAGRGLAWLSYPFSLLLSLLLRIGRVGLAWLARGVVLTAWGGSWPVRTVALWSAARFRSAFRVFSDWYGAMIARVLLKPWRAIVMALASAVVAWALSGQLGTELVPEVHQGRFQIDVALPVGTPLARTVREVEHLETLIKSDPDVISVYSRTGTDGGADAKADEGENTSTLRVEIHPGDNLAERETAAVMRLRSLLDGATDASLNFSTPGLVSVDAPLEVIITGNDLERLKAVGDAIVPEFEASEALTDVRTSLTTGNPEVRIHYDRLRLARLGLDTRTVAQRVRDRVEGASATEFGDGEQRIPIEVRLTETQRDSRGAIGEINVNPNVTPPIPLRSVADLELGVGPSEIRRVDQQRAVVISANLEGLDLGGAIREIQTRMSRTSLDSDMRWSLGGQAHDLSGAATSMLFAMLLAIFLVYVIMASTFESFLHPLIILCTVPLAAIGVVGGLWIDHTPLSVIAALGIIVLVGVVVNNAIVLVDAINQLRTEGMAPLEAVATAAKIRLRPILITTSTNVLGLIPLLIGSGAGVEIQRPLAVTMVWGMTSSMLLTLVVIPATYAILARAERPKEEAP